MSSKKPSVIPNWTIAVRNGFSTAGESVDRPLHIASQDTKKDCPTSTAFGWFWISKLTREGFRRQSLDLNGINCKSYTPSLSATAC